MQELLLTAGSIAMLYGLVRMLTVKNYPPAHVCVLYCLALGGFSWVYSVDGAWLAALLTLLQSLCWMKLALRSRNV